MNKKSGYTVVGYYADNDQRGCWYIPSASDAGHAEEKAKRINSEIRVCAVFKGLLKALDLYESVR